MSLVAQSEWLSTLRDLRTQFCLSRFEEESTRRLELNQRCLFLSTAAMQWLDIRLQLIGVAVVSGLGVIAVVQHQYSSVNPGESTADFGGCAPVSVSSITSCSGCVVPVRPGGSVPVLRPVHHHAPVGPHIQLHPD